MTKGSEINTCNRIEDFIVLSEQVDKVSATVELRKQIVTQKVHPEDTAEMKNEVDMYLLFGDYTFSVGTNTKKVSKSYMYGSTIEATNDAKISKNIANERLKMDYKRLKNAKVELEEKYF